MRFQNGFVVQAPIEEVWSTLLDVERVAPCMPGAQVLERVSDDTYKVAIRVKVGPVSMRYRGEVQVVDRDDAVHRATMRVKAKEARGQGTADAHVRMELSEQPDGTHAQMETEVQMSGKVAAMGQGVIADVSARLVETFAANLAAMVEGGETPAPGAAKATPPAAAPAGPATTETAAAPATGAAEPGPPAAAPAAAKPAPPAAGPPQPVPAETAVAATEPAPPEPAPAPPPRPAPAAAPPTDASLPVGKIAAGVIAGRLRDPRVLIGALATVALAAGAVGWLLGRRRGD